MSASSAKEKSPAAAASASEADYVDSAHEEDGEISDHDTPRSSSPHAHSPQSDKDRIAQPPLPTEAPPPPLPSEAPPGQPADDDGWEPVWDGNAQSFYFFNRFTNVSQWENPRIQEASQPGPPGVGSHNTLKDVAPAEPKKRVGGYDPAIHGDYDPDADYAQTHEGGALDETASGVPGTNPAEAYAATGTFNRFTGKWQRAELNAENFTDEQKSRRQMNAFFDVDAAANSHDGRSLRAERANKKLSKSELKAFKEKRREKKEEKRRAWLRD